MKMYVNHKRLRGLWLLLLCLAVFPACSDSKMPEQLIGKWQSDHERYQDCFMQIDAKRIVFGNKQQDNETGIIKKVTQIKKNSTQIVRVEYMNFYLTKFTLNLVYSNKAGDSIWFENQPAVIWKRAPLFKTSQ
jgi:hypothetical protein